MDDFESLYVLDDEPDDEDTDDATTGVAPAGVGLPLPGAALAPGARIFTIGRATTSALLTLLPDAPAEVRETPGAGTAGDRRHVPGDGDRPGDRLPRTAPISEVLELFGWTSEDGSQWFRPDHSGQSGHDATVYPATDDEPEKVTVFGAHAQAAWGLEGNDHSWSSWDLLGNVYCGGDWRLAARIAASYTTTKDLVELLEAYPSPEALAGAVPPANSVDEVLATSSLAAALGSQDGTRIDLGDKLVVCIGGPDHGIRALVQQGRGDNVYEAEKQITDWVVRRSLRRMLVSIGRDNRPDVFETRFELELVRSDGRVFPTKQMDFSIKESVSIETVHLLDAGVMLPVKADDRRQVENVMSKLGFDEIRDEYVWSSTGWAMLPDADGVERVVFLAPNGSMTADGVDDSYTVGPPPHSEDDSLKASQELLGWNGTVDDPATTVDAVRAFVATAPRRPEVPVAILGAMFAAPLRMKNRAVVGLNGAPGSNKSILSAAAYSFYSAHPVSKEALPFNISNGSSVPGAKGQLAWHRDIVLFADDYKKGNTRSEDGKKWDAIMRLLVQTAYDGQSGDMGTQGGGLRGNRPSTATLVFSGELILPEASILQRCVSLQVSPGDIHTDGLDNSYDTFRHTYGDTGVARGFCGSYLKYLANEIESHDGRIGWLGRTADHDFDECFQHYLTAQKKILGVTEQGSAEIRRAAETAAIIAVGWRWARRFAERQGFAAKLPSEREVEESVLKILEANTAEQSVSDYGLRVLATAAEMLAANNGHLLMHDGTRPVLDGGSPGWLTTQTPTGEPRWDPKGALLGYVSMDYRYVLLANDALRAIQRAANLDGLETSQLKRSLAKYVVAGTTPGERSPVSMFNRRRGFIFDLERFDLAPPGAAGSSTGSSTTASAPDEDEDF